MTVLIVPDLIAGLAGNRLGRFTQLPQAVPVPADDQSINQFRERIHDLGAGGSVEQALMDYLAALGQS